MNNSNNFNVCERCGTANPIVAKFCYQCGGALRTPEDPIVCPKCNTVNSGSARFCKFCGTKLFKGNSIKICPQCNHTVSGDALVCDKCNFQFMPINAIGQIAAAPMGQQVAPNPQMTVAAAALAYQNQAQTNVQQQVVPTQTNLAAASVAKKKTSNKQGKAVFGGILMTLLLLAFLYVSVGWDKIVNADWYNWGIFSYQTWEGGGSFNGVNILQLCFEAIKDPAATAMPVAYYILAAEIVLSLLTAVVALFISIIRIFTGKCAKRSSWWYLVMAILTGLGALMFFLATMNNGFGDKIEVLLYATEGAAATIKSGLMMYIMPAFYFVAWLLSLCFKGSKMDTIMDVAR